VPALWDAAARAGLFGERAFLRACAVRHVALPDGAGGDSVGVWPDALPRAYAVSALRAARDDAEAIAVLRDRAWDAHSTAVVSSGADRTLARAGEVAIEWRRDDPDAIELGVEAPAEAFVVLADAWFPGWSARLDGRPAPIVRTDLMFRGIAVPAGTHTIGFAYEPEGWRLGRLLAGLGWVLFAAALAALLLTWRRASRADNASPTDS